MRTIALSDFFSGVIFDRKGVKNFNRFKSIKKIKKLINQLENGYKMKNLDPSTKLRSIYQNQIVNNIVVNKHSVLQN